RHDSLLVTDDHPQPEIVALRAFRFLNGAVTDLDRKRYRADGECIGLIGAGAARGGHEALRELGGSGLIEKRLQFLAGLCGEGGSKRPRRGGGVLLSTRGAPRSERAG